MNFLIQLLSPRSRQTAQSQADHLITQLRITGKRQLKQDYTVRLSRILAQTPHQQKLMKALICKLQTAQSLEQCVKFLTIIHRGIVLNHYSSELLSGLQNLQLIIGKQFSNKIQQECSWFIKFYKQYVTYLAKLPSLAQILPYIHNIYIKNPIKDCLTHIFRLVNQFSSPLPVLTQTFNNVGRYYFKEYLDLFSDLYRVLKTQIINAYVYLTNNIKTILNQYAELPIQQLQMFIEVLPQCQLLLDKMEDIMVVKYYKGGSACQQYYIDEMKVSEILYYIQTTKKQKMLTMSAQSKRQIQTATSLQ